MEDNYKMDYYLAKKRYPMAVQDLKPVRVLEKMRFMLSLSFEKDPADNCYTPFHALVDAIKYDHQDYAEYLLKHYPHEALATTPSHTPPLFLALHHDRCKILSHILRATHCLPDQYAYINRPGSMCSEDGKTALHTACELLLSDAVLMLLRNNASPQFTDICGRTPLDIILMALWDSKVNTNAKHECLNHILMFMPKTHFKMKSALENDAKSWCKILGEHTYNYLIATNPPLPH